MTPSARHAVRESAVLPAVFLTVAAAGGFRLTSSGAVRFLPPTLFSLILAALLLGALVQSRLLRPGALVLGRPLLDSISGLWLLATLFAASAQLLGGLVPERGLLALLFNLFFAILLTNTIAAAPDGSRVLRSIAVCFGWALLMKYVLLQALHAPEPGLTARLLRALVSGATLGGVPVDTWSPAVGYVMFGAASLYLIGVFLLGRADTED